MKSGAWRVLGLLAAAAVIPACDFTFTTSDPAFTPGPQNPFTLQTPLVGQTGVWPTNTQFTWGAHPSATSYTFDLSLTSDFSQIIHTRTVSVPWVFLTVNLTHATTYYWRVSTLISGIPVFMAGSGAPFTTVIVLYGPPDPFSLTSPLDTLVDRVPDPVFVWGYASQATSYTFQIDTTEQFSNPIVDQTDLHLNQAVCTTPLAATKKYYWRVKALNSVGSRDSTPAYSTFTTGP